MSTTTEKQPILLLKTKSVPNDTYEELFSTPRDGLEFDPIFVPVLQHQFQEDGMNRFRQLLRNGSISNKEDAEYGGMIFTSQRAVEGFAKLVEEGHDDERWPRLHDIPIYTVGPATTRALRAIPQTPPLQVFGEHTGNGDTLAPYIQGHYGEWYADRRSSTEPRKPLPPLLFLVGEKRRDIIPNALMDPALPPEERIRVDETVVYGTGVMASFPADFAAVLERTRDARRRWVVVFSPTGCDGMLEGLGMLDAETGKVRGGGGGGGGRGGGDDDGNKTFIATIGPTTRAFLNKTFGYEPDVCAEAPSPEGVWKAIQGFSS